MRSLQLVAGAGQRLAGAQPMLLLVDRLVVGPAVRVWFAARLAVEPGDRATLPERDMAEQIFDRPVAGRAWLGEALVGNAVERVDEILPA